MAKLTLGFDQRWEYMLKIGPETPPFTFLRSIDVQGTTAYEALLSAFISHHSYVGRLFNQTGELEIPWTVFLWLDRKDGQETIGGRGSDDIGGRGDEKELKQMLDLPLEDGWDLYIAWVINMG
ncbi:hypothetical protein EON83_17365 [bacterium]|nr:MAG: hypothetical protein EON83_17365 [bacterium]